MLEIKNIKKSYGSHEVLKGISLHLEPGKAYGIAGENGAGKTTFFRCIAGLETCEGKIESPYKILKNHLGLLPTNPIFMSKITGWEYLKLFSIARNKVAEDFDDRNIFDLPLSEYAENYSTGMKKKLALMAVLLQENDIYILDEPFNGVDIQSNMIINSIIHELKRLGKIILISSHIFSTLTETCDEIILLREGLFALRAGPKDFHLIEKEMINELMGDKIQQLKLK
jgi:ABC-2 type transport system ATP-binding protein